MKTLAISLVSCAVLAGCGEGKSEPPAAAVQESSAPTAQQPASPAVMPAHEAPADLPVPADFEAEAETSITASNYEKELDLLEKEIAADAPK